MLGAHLMTDPAPATGPEIEPRPRLSAPDIICGAGIGLGVAATYVFIVLAPSMLAHHGVLLEALDGYNAAIIGGGAFARVGREPLLLVVLAPLLTVALYDVFYWWAGRRWGNRIVALYTANNPRAARWVARGERIVNRRGILALTVAYYMPFPNVVIYVLCGVSEMPLWAFLLGDVIGTLLWVGLLVGLGWSIGHPAVHVVNEISHYSLITTVAIVVGIVAVTSLRYRRRVTAARRPG
jgi:membrane-associated protein